MKPSPDQALAAQLIEGGRLRALVLELWQRTRMDWGFVTDRLSTTFRPYDLRHTYACLLLAKRADPGYVAAQLGHRNAATLWRHYAR